MEPEILANTPREVSKSRWIYRIFCLLLAASVLYFSWIPDPAFSEINWMPGPLSAWADRHGVVRTGVGMIPLGLLIGIFTGLNRGRGRVLITRMLGMIGLVLISEVGQLFLPQRVFDWRDFLVGSAGGMIGIAAGYLVIRLSQSFASSIMENENIGN